MWLSTIAFTVCFAVWTIFSIIGVQMKRDLGLNETQFGLLVGTPILTGTPDPARARHLGRPVWRAASSTPAVMLAAAVATLLLTFAYDYPTFLLAALGVGIAGGSFAVGIAYVSKWYPEGEAGHRARHLRRRQCRRGGHQVPRARRHGGLRLEDGRAASGRSRWLVMAVVFWFTTRTTRTSRRRRAAAHKPEPLCGACWSRCKNIQVWRFALYYFFVFGGFVALALWLPRYLIGVYGLDITTAGMIGAAYSIPASLFRIYGGMLSDKYGARRGHVLDLRRLGGRARFLLSYPPTNYVVQGIRGPIDFRLEIGADRPSSC